MVQASFTYKTRARGRKIYTRTMAALLYPLPELKKSSSGCEVLGRPPATAARERERERARGRKRSVEPRVAAAAPAAEQSLYEEFRSGEEGRGERREERSKEEDEEGHAEVKRSRESAPRDITTMASRA